MRILVGHQASVRRARTTDFTAVETLILAAAAGDLDATMTQEGRENFQNFVRAKSLSDRWRGGSHFWVAEESDRVVGFLEISSLNHIYLFFVAPDRQGCGIGRSLFERVAANTHEPLTANAAPGALPVYLRLGFHMMGSAFTRQGITAYPVKHFRGR